jgi:hypothetical protein
MKTMKAASQSTQANDGTPPRTETSESGAGARVRTLHKCNRLTIQCGVSSRPALPP